MITQKFSCYKGRKKLCPELEVDRIQYTDIINTESTIKQETTKYN